MKLSVFIFTLAVSFTAVAEPLETVESFANQLIFIVSRENKEEFTQIPCMKIDCGNLGIQYVFGEEGSITSYKRILSNDEVSFKLFGPYTAEPEYENSTYTIVFFLKSKSPFNAKGEIDTDYGLKEMNKSFLQTEITVVNDLVYFQRVPFYIETHHPYAGNY